MQKTFSINTININKKEMKKEVIKNLRKAEEEIENNEGIEASEVFKELRKKYEY